MFIVSESDDIALERICSIAVFIICWQPVFSVPNGMTVIFGHTTSCWFKAYPKFQRHGILFCLMRPISIFILYRVPILHSTWYIITVQSHASLKTVYSSFHSNTITVHISRNFIHANFISYHNGHTNNVCKPCFHIAQDIFDYSQWIHDTLDTCFLDWTWVYIDRFILADRKPTSRDISVTSCVVCGR